MGGSRPDGTHTHMTETAPEPTAPAPTAPAPTGPVTPDTKVPTFTGEFDPDRAAKALAAAREDAATEKAKRQQAQTDFEEKLKAITDALGITNPADPEKLAADLAAARTTERQRTTELAVMRAALKAGADPDALLDSRAFLSGLEALDPADPTFAAKVEDAVTKAAESNPRLKAAGGTSTTAARTPEAGRSGAEFPGGTGAPRQVTEAELKKMTPDQIVDAQEKGLLNDLLGVS